MSIEFETELNTCLRASISLIVVKTHEEERTISRVKEVTDNINRSCVTWDCADGFKNIGILETNMSQSKDPLVALDTIGSSKEKTIFILKDFHDFWANSQVRRKLRNTAQKLKYSRKSLIITTPTSKLPDELYDESVIINFDLPSYMELENVFDHLLETPNVKVNLTAKGKEKLIQAAMGMTANQAQRIFAKSIVTGGSIDDRDIITVNNEKKQVVRQSEALEFHSNSESPDNVGGLDVLKEWLILREKAFSKDAQDYGLPPLKGMALIGIPGTGKSLTAKMISNLWRLPLLRLDVGSLFGSLVGESEERTRKALKIAEIIAPCILWIDEIEKAFSPNYGDSGTSQRVFASVLTWMQEKTSPCFVVATANNINALPPELLRKGRFDEIFFLDLPTFEERKDIFSVHLKKRKRLPLSFDLDKLSRESEGFVGAEIEQSVIDAMYLAFNDGMREITTSDILENIKRQVPLSKSKREEVEGLRKWLKEGRAQSASFRQLETAEECFVRIPPLEF
ncbi:MAG: Proteasome-activating nucleotidase [Methanobacterium sp. PtaU1.Bin242]|nr:MAG: Proteasome-activating nucleotidase [Methanobacterium sp. PtaU1.Bin242]